MNTRVHKKKMATTESLMDNMMNTRDHKKMNTTESEKNIMNT